MGRDMDASTSKQKPQGQGRETARMKPGRPVRQDNLWECGDIEQDANLILGLHNSAFEKAEEAGTKLNLSPPVETTLTILKNRNGGAINRYMGLDFHGSINSFKDKGRADEW
jgi:replicative DNA helicase